MKKLIFFFYFFFIIQCGASQTFIKYGAFLQGNSENIKLNYKDTTKEIFQNLEEEQNIEISDIKKRYYINNIGIITPYNIGSTSLIPLYTYIKITSDKKTNFNISFFFAGRDEKDQTQSGTPFTIFFTNQNITFDKGKLILDGEETTVSDYLKKFRKWEKVFIVGID